MRRFANAVRSKEQIMSKHISHSLIFVALMAAALPTLAQDAKPSPDDEAKQLFQKMEDRLAAAKTLQCSLEIKSEGSGEPGFPVQKMEFTGSLALEEGNRVRLELKKTSGGVSTFPGAPFW